MVSGGNSVQSTNSFPEYNDSEADEEINEISLPQSGWIKVSCTPILSTPLGLYHITAGLLCSLINVCRMVGSFFVYQWKYGVGPYAEPILDGHTVSILGEENKKGLFESVDTIARGILETIPVIGNFAMYHSKWRFAPIFKELYEPRLQQDEKTLDEMEETVNSLKASFANSCFRELNESMAQRYHT